VVPDRGLIVVVFVAFDDQFGACAIIATPENALSQRSHKHRMFDHRVQCMPDDEVWLVGERRSTGEQKYYVSKGNLGPTISKADPGPGYIDMP
jgi:hypothetical protein